MGYQVYSMMNMLLVLLLIVMVGGLLVCSILSMVFPLVGVKKHNKVLFVLGCVAQGLCFVSDLIITTISFFAFNEEGVLGDAGLVFLVIILPIAVVRNVLFIIAVAKKLNRRGIADGTR